MRLGFALIAVLVAFPQDPKPVPPLKAAFFTGGGYHDYKKLTPLLAEKISELAHVTFDLKWIPEGFQDPKLEEAYDVFVYSLCLDHPKDPSLVDRLRKATEDGKPTVLIHCALHCFRDKGDEEKWTEFCGMATRRHDPYQAFGTEKAAPDHPILKTFPDAWSTPGDELYQTISLGKESTALLKVKSPHNGKEHVVCWVRSYGKGRIFATTLGHDLKTAGQADYHRLLAMGLLWSAGKLGDDGKPAAGYAVKGSR